MKTNKNKIFSSQKNISYTKIQLISLVFRENKGKDQALKMMRRIQNTKYADKITFVSLNSYFDYKN